ncbi:MAG: hypothetical protein ACP5D2_05315 [Candidatus Nanoarchaeia archaeon]
MLDKKEMRKQGAMQLSIGTIVIVVLAMTMLILGIVLITNIFEGAGDAVDATNEGVINEINNLFVEKDQLLAFAPKTRRVELKQGESNKGFAFSIRNIFDGEKQFLYDVDVDSNFNIGNKCSGLSAREAFDWILIPSGSVTLAEGKKMEHAAMVMFEIPETAPVCIIPYKVEVKSDGKMVSSATVYVEIISD